MDWFCGAGGSSQGAHAVPGVHIARAANHWDLAIESHASNFPATDHYLGDIRTAPVHRWPVADLLWASPECPQWSAARGARRDFHNSLQTDLLELPRDERVEESRALMEEVPQYLRGVIDRGGRVRAGVVENVIDVRNWDQWPRWVAEIRALDYYTRLVALNSMHAQAPNTPAAPQSRDRLYLCFWDARLGRNPDWDKWLRPLSYCHGCDEVVPALQVFKNPHADMGRYRQQYLYRCPRTRCRNTILEPPVLPAMAAIDWTLPGIRIGDRAKPLAEKTMARIRAGLQRYSHSDPAATPATGTGRTTGSLLTMPAPAHAARATDAAPIPTQLRSLMCLDPLRPTGLHESRLPGVGDSSGRVLASPPLLVPMEGRDGKEALPATVPLRTQTTRAETALAYTFVPFITELHGTSGTRPVTEPLAAITAGGNHHALTTPPARVLAPKLPCDISDVRLRMLEPHEVSGAMAFTPGYIVVGSKRARVRQLGNAVTPPVAEVLISALAEAITGQDLQRWPTAA